MPAVTLSSGATRFQRWALRVTEALPPGFHNEEPSSIWAAVRVPLLGSSGISWAWDRMRIIYKSTTIWNSVVWFAELLTTQLGIVWFSHCGFFAASQVWLPEAFGIVMEVSRDNFFTDENGMIFTKDGDLIIVYSYLNISLHEWFSELLPTKIGTWSFIHMNGMIYRQVNAAISHDLGRKKMCVYNESVIFIAQTISIWWFP